MSLTLRYPELYTPQIAVSLARAMLLRECPPTQRKTRIKGIELTPGRALSGDCFVWKTKRRSKDTVAERLTIYFVQT